MTTLKARKRRVRRRSAKKRVRRTKGKKKRSRRRLYKGGMCLSDKCKKWNKHMTGEKRKALGKSISVANNQCIQIPRGYYEGIRKRFNTDPENPQISEKNVRLWGDKMRADAINECESNASATTGTANPVDSVSGPHTMAMKAVGEPVFNEQGELISGIAPTVIPDIYKIAADGGGRRKSRRRRRRRRKKSKQSKKRRRRKR